MKLIEKIFLENRGLKTKLAKKIERTVSNINLILKNDNITINVKIKWTLGINEILLTSYTWQDLFSEIEEND
ncbi:hypothetical protein DLH72_01190 [Candidatus Gracilibacteria bacterium]|nr:MAG: hypothetical protein DLH72_01190 [Candidatus Gracilibacteria bacterium]